MSDVHIWYSFNPVFRIQVSSKRVRIGLLRTCMRKSQRTEMIMRYTKIEETGRCPFDVHTTLVECQGCFCVTFGRGGRNRMSDIEGIRYILLRCKPSSSLRVPSSRVWRASVSAGSVANEWLEEEEAVPGIKNIGRNIMM